MKKLLSPPLLSVIVCITIISLLNKFFPTDNGIYKPPALYLFSHGIANTYRQVYNYVKQYAIDGQVYTNERFLLHQPFFSFDYPDATTGFWRINFWKTSLGQNNEIQALHNAYNDLLAQHKQKQNTVTIDPSVVIFGVSRGASTIINFLAIHNPSQVKAVILESPFDCGESIAQNLLEQCNIKKSERLQIAMHNLLTIVFRKYRIAGIQPINTVMYIQNKKIPILIICSKQDQLVPWHSSKKIYDVLKKLGYVNTHILIVDNGAHDKILAEDDGLIYQQTVHAFYAKYGLLYDKEKAFYGKNILAKCQP